MRIERDRIERDRIVRDRVGASVLVIATVLAMWVGLTAPATSPVQAPVPAGQGVAAAPAP